MEDIIYTGVIEDRNDPLSLGRARVRVFGLHTADKNLLPTEALPWASMLAPNIGTSSSGALRPGSNVAIIFLDKYKQMPLMIGGVGNLPSYEESCSNMSTELSSSSPSNYSNAPSDLPPLAKAVTHGEAKSYDAWYGHANGEVLPQLNKKVTECTIGEIMQNAPARLAATRGGGSAVGIYQWIPDTLKSIVKHSNLSLQDKFSPETQNLLFLRGYCSINGLRPAIGKYLAGSKNDQGNMTRALQACAMEWASVEWVDSSGNGTGDIYSAYKKNNKLGTKAIDVKKGLEEQWDWNKENNK